MLLLVPHWMENVGNRLAHTTIFMRRDHSTMIVATQIQAISHPISHRQVPLAHFQKQVGWGNRLHFWEFAQGSHTGNLLDYAPHTRGVVAKGLRWGGARRLRAASCTHIIPKIFVVIYPIQMYISKYVQSPTLCPKGTQKPSNLHSSPMCWHDISNINIYLQVTYTPQIVGIIYPIQIYISKYVHSPTLCQRADKNPLTYIHSPSVGTIYSISTQIFNCHMLLKQLA